MFRKQLTPFLFAATAISATSNAYTEGALPFSQDRDAAVYFLKPIFSIIDCESGGVIEDGDVDEHFTDLFFYNDRDQSRAIVESEFVRARSKETKQQSAFVFKMMDTDSNGFVTPQEYRHYVSFAINAADKDKNGELYAEELLDDNKSQKIDTSVSQKPIMESHIHSGESAPHLYVHDKEKSVPLSSQQVKSKHE